jgi:hypothetical protein
MYRYSVDNAVTYTSEDFVLFRESPFACWMERLSLENPDHGIPPDAGSLPPGDSIERQDDMADTLRSEGKDVCLVDWDADEPERRSATLEAMRKGVDFIVNGQLALGPLSGTANLLVRTSGYSELGDFLYIPCDTQAKTRPHSEFRLCFLADLLHSLQGQLPPQMLVIRGGDDLVPLQTEDHIYHYRAVKQRFMETMRGFRKHRMQDPAESAHFGRWSDCAHEVLKQRLLREEQVGEEITDDDYAEPMRKAAGGAAGAESAYEPDDIEQPAEAESDDATTALSPGTTEGSAGVQSSDAGSAFTLAEQAHMLTPDSYKPGPGVYRLGPPRVVNAAPPEPAPATPEAPVPAPEPSTEGMPKYNRRASDKTLQNLEFIGSNPHVPGLPLDTAPALGPAFTAAPEPPGVASTAPAPSLRDPRSRSAERDEPVTAPAPDSTLGMRNGWDLPEGGEKPQVDEPLAPDTAPLETPAEPGRLSSAAESVVDMDATHLASPPSELTTSDSLLAEGVGIGAPEVGHGFGQAAPGRRPPSKPPFGDSIFDGGAVPEGSSDESKFSSSLITSDSYDE